MRDPGYMNYPIQGFVFAVALGIVLVGLPLWLLSLIL
jgi:hypothetical protein